MHVWHIQALRTLWRVSWHTGFHSEAVLTYPPLASTRTGINILFKIRLVAPCCMDSSCSMTLVPCCQKHAEPQVFFLSIHIVYILNIYICICRSGFIKGCAGVWAFPRWVLITDIGRRKPLEWNLMQHQHQFVRKDFTLITDMAYGNKRAIYKYSKAEKTSEELVRGGGRKLREV